MLDSISIGASAVRDLCNFYFLLNEILTDLCITTLQYRTTSLRTRVFEFVLLVYLSFSICRVIEQHYNDSQ